VPCEIALGNKIDEVVAAELEQERRGDGCIVAIRLVASSQPKPDRERRQADKERKAAERDEGSGEGNQDLYMSTDFEHPGERVECEITRKVVFPGKRNFH